jgi:hypothetical protein
MNPKIIWSPPYWSQQFLRNQLSEVWDFPQCSITTTPTVALKGPMSFVATNPLQPIPHLPSVWLNSLPVEHYKCFVDAMTDLGPSISQVKKYQENGVFVSEIHVEHKRFADAMTDLGPSISQVEKYRKMVFLSQNFNFNLLIAPAVCMYDNLEKIPFLALYI